jgi:hypothetical protein
VFLKTGGKKKGRRLAGNKVEQELLHYMLHHIMTRYIIEVGNNCLYMALWPIEREPDPKEGIRMKKPFELDEKVLKKAAYIALAFAGVQIFTFFFILQHAQIEFGRLVMYYIVGSLTYSSFGLVAFSVLNGFIRRRNNNELADLFRLMQSTHGTVNHERT